MPHPLPYTCPDCGRKLRGLTSMTHATQVVTRTCQCRAKWQITIVPRPIKGGQADIGTFQRK